MTKSTDIRIVETRSETEFFPYRSPIKFGGRVVKDATLLNAYVRVRTRDGKEALGYGSMPLGNVWAWPSQTLSAEQTLQTMSVLGMAITAAGANCNEFAHPLELTYRFAKEYDSIAAEISQKLQVEPIVKLAQLVAASPFEAAVFDAYGKVLGQNSYNLLSSEFCNCDLSNYLGEDFKGEYLDKYTHREPKEKMPLYHLVGALDPLTSADVQTPINDGLPEHFADWIPYNGLTHFKIKLNGDDLDWDVQRVCDVERICEEQQKKRGIKNWFYSADFNEKCRDVDYVMSFLQRIKERAPNAIERLQYIEQPTNRDMKAFPENKMHKAAALKPVVIDEALVDLESLLFSREMGYSGVALKACKGHSEALLMGAAAQKYNMFLCVQDLTCPGASFLHSASLSARMPGVAAIEGNGRQYCPAANAKWEKRYPSMFCIKDGMLGTSVLNEPGLGFSW